MEKITKLTPNQKARIPVIREDYRFEALRTDTINEVRARDSIIELYESAGLDKPKLILFAQSPMQAQMMRSILSVDDGQLSYQLLDQLSYQLGDQLSYQLGDQIGDQIGDQLNDQLWDQLNDQLWDQLGGQLWDQLGGQLWDQLGDQLWIQLSDELRGQLGDQLWIQLRCQLNYQLRDQLKVQLKSFDGIFFSGAADGYWLSFYMCGVEFGAEISDVLKRRMLAYRDYIKECGVAFLYKDVAIICDRPCVLKFDDSKMLHSDDGPAIKWRDGYSLYSWHGTRMPPEWFDGDNCAVETILKHNNTEQRAAGLQYIGLENVLDYLEHRIIDSDPDPLRGDLIALKIPGLQTEGIYLKAECPRNGTIMEAVPPISDIDEKPIDTVLAAQAWRVRMTPSEFKYPSVRT